MTKQQLKQFKYLKSEIKMLREQVDNLKAGIVSDVVEGSESEFPYTKRRFVITGIDYKEYEKKTKRLQKHLQRRVDELMDLLEEINKYIEGIDDSLLRQIISLRHVNGLTWDQVAASIGGGNTGDGVRMMHDRYFKGS